MARIFLPLVASVFAFVFWFFGSPPPSSLTWTTAQTTVVGHVERQGDTGWGLATFVLPELALRSESGDRIKLWVDGAAYTENRVRKSWPVGAAISVRLAPGGKYAFPASIWPPMLFPALALSGLAGFLWYRVYRFRRAAPLRHPQNVKAYAAATGRLVTGVFGLVFFVIPLGIGLVANATFDPSLNSIFWPRSKAVVSSSTYKTYAVGNGTTMARVHVTLENEVELTKVTYSGVSVQEAKRLVENRYAPGTVLPVMTAPDASVYEVRWRFSDTFGMIFLLVGSVCFTVSFFAFRLAFT